MDTNKAILEIASKETKFKTSDVVKALKGNVSRQFVSSEINKLVKEGKLIKGGSTKSAFYTLPSNASVLGTRIHKRLINENLKEHEVFDDLEHQTTFIESLRENILSILAYAFSEMLNNAIEHSKSQYVEVTVEMNQDELCFVVDDFGIGAFKNVMVKRKLKSEIEAIQDLLKGKTTTQPQAHSGEGIFFTSKAADIFILESYGYRLRIDNVIHDVFIEEIKPAKQGTKVTFKINANSKKHLNAIFKEYQTDPEEMAFDKTEIKIKLFTMGTIYISRSQARRVLTGLEKFKTVILD
ncbi:MAG TPA: ATP-binding protein, partial [Cytophaga sp.]|nr:ATP-binding protein [Cytophaga sp.]